MVSDLHLELPWPMPRSIQTPISEVHPRRIWTVAWKGHPASGARDTILATIPAMIHYQDSHPDLRQDSCHDPCQDSHAILRNSQPRNEHPPPPPL